MVQTELLFDGQLHDLADLLEGSPNRPGGVPDVPPGITPESTVAYQVWEDGILGERSANAPKTPIGPFEPGYHENNFGGRRWRLLVRRSRAVNRWLLVAERADVRFQVAEDVILQAVTPIILGLPIAGLLIWAIVGYGLRPLSQLAEDLGTKADDDLSPLQNDRTPAELEQVIQSTNDLLNRLAASFERERRFAADAAHELRTPISVLNVQLHNLALELPTDNPNIINLKTGVDRMSHLVEQILALHRTAPDQFMANFTTINLAALARDTIGRRYTVFSRKNQQIELTGHDASIVGDRFALETLLENLLSNATKYTPDGGRILVTVEQTETGALLQVEDSGPGIDPEDRARVFERFYRVGGDRHASNQPGCGLGLAIVRHITDLHNARITLGRSAFDSGLRVSIEFPASTASAGTHRE